MLVLVYLEGADISSLLYFECVILKKIELLNSQTWVWILLSSYIFVYLDDSYLNDFVCFLKSIVWFSSDSWILID